MMRIWSIIFGIGLIVLWLVGMNSPEAAPWLMWLDGLAGVAAFILAGLAAGAVGRRVAAGGPVGLASALFLMWIVGLITRAAPWQSWWTFVFACAFLLLGVNERKSHTRIGGGPGERPSEEMKERFKKSA